MSKQMGKWQMAICMSFRPKGEIPAEAGLNSRAIGSNSRFGNCAADNYSAGLIFAGVRAELAELTNQNSIILEILL